MLDRSRRPSRHPGLLLIAALIFSLGSASSAEAGKKVKVHRGPRGRLHVNVHRRPGFWRGVRVGAAVATLPLGHRRIVVRGSPYFYHEGAYYRPAARGYVVAAAPVGAVIAAVPAGCVPVKHGNVVYQHCAGTFYSTAPGGFVVVEPPIGVTVDELPIGCEETVDVGAVEHYSCSGVLYKPDVRGSGTVYITVRP